MSNIRIIHIVHGKANPTGHNGISRVVYHLNKQEKLQGVDSEIWALVDDAKSHYTHQRDEFVTVECFPRVRLPWGSHEIIERLISEKESIGLVHFHLIWFYDKNIIAKALCKAGIPYIITTHGTYSKPHAYTGKRLLAKWLFEVDYLDMATEIHTITREEGTGLQKYGYCGRSFVAYNGIDLDEVPSQRRSDFFADKPYRDKVKLIWVGVLREDKNLRGLIEAFSLLPAAIRDHLVCVLVGPDYKGNAAKYLALGQELDCAANFDYIGPLYDQQKYDAIESADLFVLPSFSEVFSLAMLDAMACAKPCLVSSGCGYNYFIRDDFFAPCEPYPQDVAFGIQEILGRRADWPQMGRNGRQAIEQKFNWRSIAQVMIANYSRILKGAA
jgi:glycosyltransferase involved in cell wall biosynthesis